MAGFMKDWKDITHDKTVERTKLKIIAEMEVNVVKAKEPFCRPCALYAIDDSLAAKKRQLERKHGVAPEDHADYITAVEETNIEEFRGVAQFNVAKETPITEYKILPSGEKEPYMSGFWITYECKRNPHHKYDQRLTVSEYEAFKNKKK